MDIILVRKRLGAVSRNSNLHKINQFGGIDFGQF